MNDIANGSSLKRRADVDWLRVLATYLLFVFHAGMVFSPAPFYHVRNGELSMVLLVVTGFIGLWHMPLFFLLAGWSIVASLRTRGDEGFVRERLLRLGVPLLLGCVFMMPAIKYLELSSGLDLNHRGLFVSPALQEGFRRVIPDGLPEMAPFSEGFAQFLPTFYTRLDRFTWAHLWFVAYLLTFTLLYRPLVRRVLASREWRRPAVVWVYAPFVPLVLAQVLLRPHWPGIQNLYDDWANVAYYSTFLLAGVVLARHPALETIVVAERRRTLGIAVATTLVLLLVVLGVITNPLVPLAGSAVAAWCFVLTLLGHARAWRLPDGPVLAYLAESAFPVYVLHQLAVVVIGYQVVGLAWGVAAKFVVLVVASLAATLATYHLIVRPLPPLRFAFGMRPRVCPFRAAVPAGAALGIALVLSTASAAFGATAIGRWYAEGGAAQVELRACGTALCGDVVWLRSPFDEHGCPLRDRWNPDPALRARSIEGLEIVRGLVPLAGSAGEWVDGSIYDPTSGRTYRATLALDGEDRAFLRGYVGIPLLGRTTTWVRVGREAQQCRASAVP
jgi:glucan biosynthesis protein C